jgi:hypothetical protein
MNFKFKVNDRVKHIDKELEAVIIVKHIDMYDEEYHVYNEIAPENTYTFPKKYFEKYHTRNLTDILKKL